MPDDPRSPGAALFSLSDKTGSVELARALAARNVEIFATSGTRSHLEQHGLAVRDVEELTGFPALFDGRVKTLHPRIFGAILYDRDRPEHRAQAEEYAMADVSVVAVNLYPLQRGEIDVGGVALLRAGAKNYKHVTVLSAPYQYAGFRRALSGGGPDEHERKRYAVAAFELTAKYDLAIAERMMGGVLVREVPLRYGENPQLTGAYLRREGMSAPEQLHGKELSYNNLLDLDAALRLLSRAKIPVEQASFSDGLIRAVVVKHTVPCGVAQRPNVAEAVGEALAADSVSAFGGIVATDASVDLPAAERLAKHFLELVAAPGFEVDALALLKRKKQLRIMVYPARLPDELQQLAQTRSALGSVLRQTPDSAFPAETWRTVSRRTPSVQEWQDLGFAWDVVRHVKSNGVVIVREGVTRGICAGQTNRVSAVEIAAARAGDGARGAACASDGFFPFADGLEAAAAAGCSAVIAPGGSVRDAEVIAAADRLGVSLIFSSYRYFSH